MHPHGNYKLHHIFTNIFLGKGYEQYDNLMSYKPGATNLVKAQWDIIHDPGVIWGFAARDGDQGVVIKKGAKINDFVKFMQKCNTSNEENCSGIDCNFIYLNYIDYTDVLYYGNVNINNIPFPCYLRSTYIPKDANIKMSKNYIIEESDEIVFNDDVNSFPYTVTLRYCNTDGGLTFFFRSISVLLDFLKEIGYTITPLNIYEGTTKKMEDYVFLINSVPNMPDIRLSVFNLEEEEHDVKFEIHYLRQCTGSGSGRTPNQSISFPATGWQKLKKEEIWDVEFGVDNETNRELIRGGIAYFIHKKSNNEFDTLRVFIKGENPTVADVNNYLNQSPFNEIWFFKKMVFHESGTPNNLTAEARQFNPHNSNYENLATDWNAWSRCPTFGPPCGWGLMQLDNPPPNSQSLWDWQSNIIDGENLLSNSKFNMVYNHIRNEIHSIEEWNTLNPDDPVENHEDHVEGSTIFTHSLSSHFAGIPNIANHFPVNNNQNNRSFIDACWIKTYNGLGTELLHYYYLVFEAGKKPEWEIQNIATYSGNSNNYVRSICNQQTP